MHQFFKSTFFNFELVRILSAAPFEGADIAECLVACSQIRDGDPESWHRAWYAQAEKALQLGEEAEADPESHEAPENEKVAVTTTMRDSASAEKRPLLIHLGGVDSSKEELYYVYAATGPELGYAVLTLDGPGQGSLLRQAQNSDTTRLTSRPDWEHVISYFIDYLERLAASQPEVYRLDLSRIAVAGASMGACYALRATADPRVTACVALDPFYDVFDFATAHMGPVIGGILGAWLRGWVPSSVVDTLMRTAMAVDFRTQREVGLVQWLMGASSPTQALLQMRRYTFKQEDGTSFLTRVKCPVLVSSAGQSLYLEPGTDAQRVHDGLSQVSAENKSTWFASKPEEGGLQAKIGAIGLCAQRTFSFLDKHLGYVGVVPGSGDSSTTGGTRDFEHI